LPIFSGYSRTKETGLLIRRIQDDTIHTLAPVNCWRFFNFLYVKQQIMSACSPMSLAAVTFFFRVEPQVVLEFLYFMNLYICTYVCAGRILYIVMSLLTRQLQLNFRFYSNQEFGSVHEKYLRTVLIALL